MTVTTNNTVLTGSIEDRLQAVNEFMVRCLEETPLGFLSPYAHCLLGSGKMLRSRLLFRVGAVSGAAEQTLVHAAAAAEMVHSASLLHDDVIDGGMLRRGAPAFWLEKGVSGAILLGDMLLFKALDVMCQVEQSRLAPLLVRLTGEVCQAEAEQELIFRGREIDWEECVRIARSKTGALFAFAAHAAGGPDAAVSAALQEAGYLIGTAYQLADDVLDAKGDEQKADKTLGTDSARNKNTVMRFLSMGVDPTAYVDGLCRSARRQLNEWPEVQAGWDVYMKQDFLPAVQHHLEPSGETAD